MKNKYILILLFVLLLVWFSLYYKFLYNIPNEDKYKTTISDSSWNKFEKNDFDDYIWAQYKAIRFKDEKYCIWTIKEQDCLSQVRDNINFYNIRLNLAINIKQDISLCDKLNSNILKNQCNFIIKNNIIFRDIVKKWDINKCNNFPDKVKMCTDYIKNINLIEENISNCMNIEDNVLLQRCQIARYMMDLKKKDICHNLSSIKLEKKCLDWIK